MTDTLAPVSTRYTVPVLKSFTQSRWFPAAQSSTDADCTAFSFPISVASCPNYTVIHTTARCFYSGNGGLHSQSGDSGVRRVRLLVLERCCHCLFPIDLVGLLFRFLISLISPRNSFNSIDNSFR